MYNVHRHLEGAQGTSVCFIFSECSGETALLWSILGSLQAAKPETSPACVVFPFLDSRKTTKFHTNIASDAPVIWIDGPKWDCQSLFEYFQEGVERARCDYPTKRIFIFIESVSAYLLSYPYYDVVGAISRISRNSDVYGIIGVCNGQHCKSRIIALKSIATCEVLLKAVNSVQSEVMLRQSEQKVQIEVFVTTLRHSGASYICNRSALFYFKFERKSFRRPSKGGKLLVRDDSHRSSEAVPCQK
jgi:hypothetical protein